MNRDTFVRLLKEREERTQYLTRHLKGKKSIQDIIYDEKRKRLG